MQILATILLANLANLAAGAISNVCSDVEVSYSDPGSSAPVYLSATCKANKGTRCSQLDLNQCLGLDLDTDGSSPATIIPKDG